MDVSANASEGFMAVAIILIVSAYVLFIMMGFAFSVKVPTLGPEFEQLSGENSEATAESAAMQEQSGPDFSFLWIALLAVSIIITVIGARLVLHTYRTVKK